jgi:peroxiredoxin
VDDLISEGEARQLRERRKGDRTPLGVSRRGVYITAALVLAVVVLLAVAVANPFRPASPSQEGLAPDFTLTTTDGGTVTLSSLQGQPVLLEFMDVDCPHCGAEAREVLAPLHGSYGSRVHFLSINVNFVGAPDDDGKINAFRIANGTPWAYALDADGGVTRAYGVRATPTTFILDGNGAIVTRFEGRPSGGYWAYSAVLDELLGG